MGEEEGVAGLYRPDGEGKKRRGASGMGHLPYAGDGFPRMAGDWRRKAPRKKGNTGKKKGKGNKGADRWATHAVSEGRTDGACGRRPK